MMRWFAPLLLALPLWAAGCKDTNAGACRNYVQASNQCSNALGGGNATVSPLAADSYCLAFGLPGVPRDQDTIDAFNCQAESLREADCSSQEAFEETYRDVCDDVPDEAESDEA